MTRKRIKKQAQSSPRLKKSKIERIDFPIFSFRYLSRTNGLNRCEKDEKSALIEQISRISTYSWAQLATMPRHGLGYEKIAQNSIKPSIPNHLSADVDFIAFRFQGKKPFIGYKDPEQKNILHIVYIDNKFDVYRH